MRTRLAPLLALVAFLLASCTGELAFPAASLTTVTPVEITSEGVLTIEGENFYQYPDGEGTRVEACGVSVPAEIVGPSLQQILLPPGDRVAVEAGDTLTATLPSEGLEAGVSDVRIVRPDGTGTVLEDAVTCIAASDPDPDPDPEPDPDPDPEPEPVPAHAIITSSTTSGPAPLTVDFHAGDSTGEGDLTYAWDFGNDHTSTSVTDTQTFPTPDTYTVTLTVTDETGASDTATETITVTPSTLTARAAIHLDPVSYEAEEGADPADGYIVTFDGTASTDPTGDGLTYSWSIFDDSVGTGATLTPPEPAPADAVFMLTLTVTDSHGNSDDVTLYTLLDPYGDADGGEETRQADILRLTWYDGNDGGVFLELETANEHPILQPGQSTECEAPEPEPVAQQVTDDPMVGILPFNTNRDAEEEQGEEPIPGFPGGDQAIVLLARNMDGSFPILDTDATGCDLDTPHSATVTQDGSLLTFHLPEAVAPEAYSFEPGAILGLAETLDTSEFSHSDIASMDPLGQ